MSFPQDDEKFTHEIHDRSHVEITPNIWKNIGMDKVSKDRGYIQRVTIRISQQRLFQECQQAIPNMESPGIPIATDGTDTDEKTKHCTDRLKIVDIGAKGIHVGVRYGHNEQKLFAISVLLQDELPDDLITIIAGFSLEFELKSFIYEQMRILDISGGKLSYDDMIQYNKWIINMQIIDYEVKLKQMVNGCIGLDVLKRCFKHHSRKEFTESLDRHGIKTGPALKLFMLLSQQRDIKILNNY